MTTKGRSWYRGQYDAETGAIIGSDSYSAPPVAALRAAEQKAAAMNAMAARIVREFGEPHIKIAEIEAGTFRIETEHYIGKFQTVNAVQVLALRGLAGVMQ